MAETKVKHLAQEIMSLSEGERQELATEVLPLLLLTRGGIEAIDQALHGLSEEDLNTLVERARSRHRETPEHTIAAVISEALKAVRAASRA